MIKKDACLVLMDFQNYIWNCLDDTDLTSKEARVNCGLFEASLSDACMHGWRETMSVGKVMWIILRI